MTDQKDDLIASTVFIYKGSKTEVYLYKPKKKWIDGEEFTCKFAIEGQHMRHIGENIGYDSMQSVILSLYSIGHYLRESEDVEQEFIEWPGGKMKFPEI